MSDMELVGPDDTEPVLDDQVGVRIDQTSSELNQLLAEARALSAELSSDPGVALVAVAGRSPANVKQQMALTRASVMKQQQKIVAKQAELKDLLERKMREVSEIIAPLNAMVKKLEEGIWTANLYLGRDEEIIQLRDGEPASSTTPITVRQLVLAMDEECAASEASGGIDAMSMETFDEWLLADESHLDQVFPEERGVVALVPRWSEVDYGNPWESTARNQDNHQTYFLIRNGARLYRYVTDFIAGERLVPTAAEFTDFFYTRGGYSREREPLKPGTDAWHRAETSADARKRHYMRVGLILQGLVDRTAVFHPLPGTVRFLEPDDYDEGRIVIIADGDQLLDDGAEPFREWQRRLMREVRPGVRIIGAFNTYDARESWTIHPPRASKPDSFIPHTVTERVGERALKITYARTDEVWRYVDMPDRPGYERLAPVTPRTRASCTFSIDTDLVLPFDLIAVEDVDRYLRSRTDRHRYVRMFPLLKAARRTKLAEIEQEAPFRLLLTGLLARESGVGLDAAASSVPELVDWWKVTNKSHRPLVGSAEDNAKAVRLIIAEHARRLAAAARPLDQSLVKRLRSSHADAVVIGRRRDGTYVVLDPQDGGNTFVCETIYSAKGVVKDRQEWQLVGTRPSRWVVAHASTSFATWNVLADRRNVFTAPEIADATDRLVTTRTDQGAVVVAVMIIDGTQGARRQSTLLAALEVRDADAGHLTAEYWDTARAHPLTGPSQDLELTSYTVSLGRDGDGQVTWRRRDYGDSSYPTAIAWPVWEPSGQYTKGWRRVWLSDAAAAAANLAHDRYDEIAHLARSLDHLVNTLESSVVVQFAERAERRAYDEFLEEYHDPELWDGVRKSLRVLKIECGRRDFDDVERALSLLVEGGHVLDGLSVREALEHARTLYSFEGTIPHEMDDFILSSAR